MIKLFDPVVDSSVSNAIFNVLDSGWLGQGPVTELFEKSFAEYVGSKYAIAVNSATSALHLAVKSLNLSPGDEVITTPFTFVSTNHAILYEQLIPVFCDIEPKSLNIDLNRIPSLITQKTKAIMVVHYAGNPVDLDQLYSLAKTYNLKVIEDAAHACGASYKGKKIGSFGLTCFSFQAVKNLPAGDGGLITTNDEEVYNRLIKLRWMGIDKSTFNRTVDDYYSWNYNVDELGYKYHMNDITASIALEGLKNLDHTNLIRENMVEFYRSKLSPNIQTLPKDKNNQSSNHLFVIRIKDRNQLHTKLALEGISTGVHYKPNHLYSIYARYRRGKLFSAEEAFTEVLSLPLHLRLSEHDIELICSHINNHLDRVT